MAVLFVFSMAFHAKAAEYTIDPVHSRVSFKVRHLGISSVTGQFNKFSGVFLFDTADIRASRVKAQIEVPSISTSNKKRDRHLKSKEFFNISTYPLMAFESEKITGIQGNSFNIQGKLTLHGVTKKVVLHTEFHGVIKDPWGNQRAAFTASAKINRKDYGLIWNKLLETGGLMVGEEVNISIEIEAVVKKESKSKVPGIKR